MENTLYIALSKQTCLWRDMEITGNNLANMNTNGYKAIDPLFTQYLTKTNSPNSSNQTKVSFAQDFGVVNDLSNGPIKSTENKLDVALEGDGFLAFDTPQGEMYSRNGQLSLNNEGMIVSSEGYPLLSATGTPFFIAPGENQIEITKEGNISTENGSVGKIKLAAFANPQAIKPVFSGLCKPNEGNEVIQSKNTKVIQGALEGSNVQAIPEMTKLISIQRQFEHVQKMIEAENQRQSRAMSVFSGVQS